MTNNQRFKALRQFGCVECGSRPVDIAHSNFSEIGDTQKLSRFLDQFEFFADDMGYGKFKNWCVNGVKPN